MKSALIVFAAIVACVFAQVPADGNPTGAPYFASGNTFYLPLNNTPISSMLYDYSSDYATFFWGYIPETVGEVFFSLNISDTCTDYVYAYINFVEPKGDTTVGFTCTDGYYYCDNYDYYFDTFSQATYSYSVSSSSSWRPGKFYVTVQSSYAQNCSFTFQASTGFNCSAGQIAANDDGTPICLSYKNVTSNGQNFFGYANYTGTDADVYRVDVPRNVSKVYVYAYSQSTYLNIIGTAGYAAAYYYDGDTYISSWDSYYGLNESIYTYYFEYDQPLGDTPLFITILADYDDSIPYNISVHWVACGATTTGLGYYDVNGTTPALVYAVPDCYAPVTFTNLNIAGTGNYQFNLPAYNSTDGFEGAAYGFIEVAAGTLGAVNFTCSTNGTTSNYMVFSKGQMSDCNNNYASWVYCDGSSYIRLLSQDLYVGGYWTVGACNVDYNSTSITIAVGGSVTLPSPSSAPAASASSSPGSGSSGQDSSSASAFLPALFLIALAVLVQF